MSVDKIVVGYDYSDHAMTALRWAKAEAEQWKAHLVVVHAWEFPLLPDALDAPTLDLPAMRADSEARVVADVEELFGPGHDVEIVQSVDLPARAVLTAAQGADLVVVGSRGRGGLKGMLLGSVSLKVVQHATCPVVVVRP